MKRKKRIGKVNFVFSLPTRKATNKPVPMHFFLVNYTFLISAILGYLFVLFPFALLAIMLSFVSLFINAHLLLTTKLKGSIRIFCIFMLILSLVIVGVMIFALIQSELNRPPEIPLVNQILPSWIKKQSAKPLSILREGVISIEGAYKKIQKLRASIFLTCKSILNPFYVKAPILHTNFS